jgi:hypothetical protein
VLDHVIPEGAHGAGWSALFVQKKKQNKKGSVLLNGFLRRWSEIVNWIISFVQPRGCFH